VNGVSFKSDFDYNKVTSKTWKAETERRHLFEKRELILQETIEMEIKMGVSPHWQPGDKEYDDAVKYIQSQKYHQALQKLCKLIVQRLFELHKLNLAQTGMFN